MATTYDKASLVMIPSGYKDDKLYSVKPTDGSGDFTFSRDGSGASPATRVNASGLIEKGRENLLAYSNTFDSWTEQNTTLTSGQSGYDGTSDAWKVEATTTATTRLLQTTSIPANTLVTMSLYAKVGNVDFIKFNLSTSGTNSIVTFDLTDGTTYSSNAIEEKWESIGGGWVRISATFLNADIISEPRIEIRSQSNTATCDAGSYVYIQDAQLEYGLVATSVIETTTTAVSAGLLGDMPRLDYSGGATCPSLLLEPSRVNYLPESEYIAGWGGANTAVVTNAAISPEGVQNASSVTFSAGGYWYKSVSLSYSAGQAFSWSIYADTQDQVTRWGGSTPAGTDTFSVVDAGNGWYRQTLTRVVSGSGTANFQPLMDSVFVGVGTTFYVYGAQFEIGSYPTSYIPTYGSASTRGEDATQQLDVSGFINGNSYTLLLNADLNDSDNNKVFMELLKTTGAGSFTFRNFNGLLRVYNQLDGNYPVGSIPSESNKWVVRVDGTSYDIFSLNSGVPTKTSGTALTTQREIGKVQFDGKTKYDLDQLLIFQTALTDAECKSLVQ